MKQHLASVLSSVVVIGTAIVGAADGAAATQHNGTTITGTWSKRVAADPDRGRPTTLTCRSKAFCVLADTYGAILVENDGLWHSSYQLAPNLLVDDVSCVSRTFCVASGQDRTADKGFVMTYDGSTWTGPDFIAPTTSVVGVSCVSTTFCMAVDYEA